MINWNFLNSRLYTRGGFYLLMLENQLRTYAISKLEIYFFEEKMMSKFQLYINKNFHCKRSTPFKHFHPGIFFNLRNSIKFSFRKSETGRSLTFTTGRLNYYRNNLKWTIFEQFSGLTCNCICAYVCMSLWERVFWLSVKE